uniref:Pentatricopeptide repeat-containing protein At1g08070 n=1 Tax=Anthurium amnicola TaxID=1678845 RepID=A0A1D1Z1H8_9ARAE
MERRLAELIRRGLQPKQLRQAHALVITRNPNLTPLFLRCVLNPSTVDYARHLFDALTLPPPTFSGSVISCYSKLSRHREALGTFFSAHRRGFLVGFYLFPPVLKACTQLSLSDEGRQVHSLVMTRGFCSNTYIQSALIAFYSNTGDLDSARRVFVSIPVKDPVMYNALISGYSKAGDVVAARQLFDEMEERTVVSWNSMITCYAHNGDAMGGLKLFERMQMEGDAPAPTEMTLVTVLSICAKLGDLAAGLRVKTLIESHNLRRNLIVQTAVLEMYVKCGAVDEARREFDDINHRDVVAWSAMIAGYAQNGRSTEALELFERMRLENVQPNEVTLVSVLSACGQLGSVESGEHMGSYVESRGFATSLYVGSALVDMYAKCGNIGRACRVFSEMPKKDVVSWNSMIVGLAFNGLAYDAISIYQKMKEANVEPNDITFTGLLTACTHAGFVDLGFTFFDSMKMDYNIAPTVEHYSCMVDLLCKSGRLEDAFKFVHEMEVEPNAVIWGTLLSACRLHSNIELAEFCVEKLLPLEPAKSSNYVVLSNLYADAGRWGDALNIRGVMKSKKVQKTVAYSWIETEDMVHMFLVGDTSHPKSDEIYDMVDGLQLQLKSANHHLTFDLALS